MACFEVSDTEGTSEKLAKKLEAAINRSPNVTRRRVFWRGPCVFQPPRPALAAFADTFLFGNPPPSLLEFVVLFLSVLLRKVVKLRKVSMERLHSVPACGVPASVG